MVPIATYATRPDLMFGEVTIVASIYTAKLITELKALIDNGCSHNCAMSAVPYSNTVRSMEIYQMLVPRVSNRCIQYPSSDYTMISV